MSNNDNNQDTELGYFLGVVGCIAGFAYGSGRGMDDRAIYLLVFLLGAIGYVIGRWVEIAIVQIIFFVAALIMFFMNMAIRSFIWGIISGLFGG